MYCSDPHATKEAAGDDSVVLLVNEGRERRKWTPGFQDRCCSGVSASTRRRSPALWKKQMMTEASSFSLTGVRKAKSGLRVSKCAAVPILSLLGVGTSRERRKKRMTEASYSSSTNVGKDKSRLCVSKCVIVPSPSLPTWRRNRALRKKEKADGSVVFLVNEGREGQK